MKKLSKILSVGLSLAMCAGLVMPSFAATFQDVQDAIDSTEATGAANGISWSTTESQRNVTLNENVTYDEKGTGDIDGISIRKGADVVLNLNGKTIDGGARFTVDEDTLEVEMTNEGSGKSIIKVERNASLTVNGADADGNRGTIKGGNASDGCDGGAICANEADTLAISDVTFTANYAADFGGAIDAYRCEKLVLTNTEFTGNASLAEGGAVEFGCASLLSLENVKFSGNSSAVGGALCVYEVPQVEQAGEGEITFESNRAHIGGAFAFRECTVNLPKASFIGNSAVYGNDVAVSSFSDDNDGSTITLPGQWIWSEAEMDEDGCIPEDEDGNYKVEPGEPKLMESLKDTVIDLNEIGKVVLLDAVPKSDDDSDNNVAFTPAVTETEIDEVAVPLAAGPVTRAEFIDYLWRHEGAPETDGVCTFADVPADHEFILALAWAEQTGVAKAYLNADGHEDGTFEPDELVTVAAVREILGNFARVFEMDVDVYALVTLTGDDDEAVLNCDEVLAEFFGEELALADLAA